MAKRPLIYITGPPGTGKTTVCAELKHRGYEAIDTDNDGIAFFYNKETDEPIVANVPSEERTPEWREKHTWKARREAVEELQERPGTTPLFLCGVTANDANVFWDVFNKIIALIVEDENELTRRILERYEDGFGKNPHELALVLKWQKTAAIEYKNLGATVLDASGPVDKVVDSILEQLPSATR